MLEASDGSDIKTGEPTSLVVHGVARGLLSMHLSSDPSQLTLETLSEEVHRGVSLGSNENVEMAGEMVRQGTEVGAVNEGVSVVNGRHV
jgi:hypothetical protein